MMLMNMEDIHLLKEALNLLDNLERSKVALENDEKLKILMHLKKL